VQRNETGRDVSRFVMRGALPVKYVSPGLNPRGNDVAIEELEITSEGIEIQD
jgi:hypothetical protein